eukprot:TRINITY_DN25821_c0_g1_i1.p1 TRINITY_DN25821_c0_g1~~TRINITY_DN25821_c0_g1_i1.p1  ORF type:complete len:344 (+),score=131.63 TRINITY_DN25821_c0_g1_i1:25-1032(+)
MASQGGSLSPQRFGGSPRREVVDPAARLKGDALLWHAGIKDSAVASPVLGRLGGYTSPSTRRQGRDRHAGYRSLCDAAWEGDVDGLAAILEQAENAKEEVDKLGVLQAYTEGLRFDPAAPLKGFHRTLHVTASAKYPRFHATPLMWAVAGRKREAVEFLLQKEASASLTADLGHDLTPSHAKHIVFANTFFHCTTASEARAARALKAVVYMSLAEEGLSATKDMTAADIASWMQSCDLCVKHAIYGKQFDAAAWVRRHQLDGTKLQWWLACDWRNAGFHRLKDLQKLLLRLLVLIDVGHKAPADPNAEKKKGDGEAGEEDKKEEKESQQENAKED